MAFQVQKFSLNSMQKAPQLLPRSPASLFHPMLGWADSYYSNITAPYSCKLFKTTENQHSQDINYISPIRRRSLIEVRAMQSANLHIKCMQPKNARCTLLFPGLSSQFLAWELVFLLNNSLPPVVKHYCYIIISFP